MAASWHGVKAAAQDNFRQHYGRIPTFPYPFEKTIQAGQPRKKKHPVFVDGARPRPMYVDYKDLELLGKLTSRQGKLIGRRKSGCTAVSQHAVTKAVKRARFMALLPYVAD